MSLSTPAIVATHAPGVRLPKPPEGCWKILRQVEGTDDPLIRLLPNGGVCIWGEIEHLEHRLGDVLTGRDVDKKPRDTRLNLIDKPTGGRGHHYRPAFPCPQRDLEWGVGEGFVSGRH